MGNFRRQFLVIMARAGIDEGVFHDFRRTCITNWFFYGLSEYEVMKMAGHASFDTTRRFYLAIREDLVDRARTASTEASKGYQLRAGCAPPLRDTQKRAAHHK